MSLDQLFTTCAAQMLDNLKNHKIILASKSPRRQFLLHGLEIQFELRTKEVDESFPSELKAEEIPVFLARHKAEAFREEMQDDEIVITADTVVWVDNEVLNKPEDREDAIRMISTLSAKTHQVFTGVCIISKKKEVVFFDETKVTFAELNPEEIAFYVDTYKPFDKAGAYGAQDWIGYVGIEKLEGSYFNVMGLPVHKLFQELKKF